MATGNNSGWKRLAISEVRVIHKLFTHQKIAHGKRYIYNYIQCMSYKIAERSYIFFTNELLAPYNCRPALPHSTWMKPAILLALLLPNIGLAAVSSKLVDAALAAPASPSDPAILALRAAGPEAFREFEKRLEPELSEYLRARRSQPDQAPNAKLQRAADLLDAAAGQRDAYVSRLFWFTDLAAAKSQAARTKRPILTLRMLGNLTEEYSCANSRLFRSLLYSDPEIAGLLREKVVLHWESVRPVPKITIDFGDGRTLHRTITGNSIHYILTPAGQIVDAFPGMYQPKMFLTELTESLQFLDLHDNNPSEKALLTRLALKRAELLDAWDSDLFRIGARITKTRDIVPVSGYPTAAQAFTLTASKTAMERPIVSRVASSEPRHSDDAEIWENIAELHKSTSVSAASREFMRTKMPSATAAAQNARSKRQIEIPLVRMMARLESSLAADTVRNQYDFRTKILARLVEQKEPALSELNDWVYATLFLTPKEDKWLGLRSNEVFTALENDGIEISQ